VREESSGSERVLNDRFFIVVLGTSERKSNKKNSEDGTT
jgi:hypothetical protein